MVVTMCTSGQVVLKAGVNHKVVPDTLGYVDAINWAEAYINSATRIDYTTAFAGLTTGTKEILTDAASSLAAVPIINNDMSGFTSRQEAITMINVNWAIADRDIDLLKTKEVAPDFLG